jgi:hypothetical protein
MGVQVELTTQTLRFIRPCAPFQWEISSLPAMRNMSVWAIRCASTVHLVVYSLRLLQALAVSTRLRLVRWLDRLILAWCNLRTQMLSNSCRHIHSGTVARASDFLDPQMVSHLQDSTSRRTFNQGHRLSSSRQPSLSQQPTSFEPSFRNGATFSTQAAFSPPQSRDDFD